LCCTVLAVFFSLELDWPEVLKSALPVFLIALAVVANLASLGSKISVEKDWVLVIAGGNKDFLAKMNSTLRTIDLLCLLVISALTNLTQQSKHLQ
jgi:hypothetical protein